MRRCLRGLTWAHSPSPMGSALWPLSGGPLARLLGFVAADLDGHASFVPADDQGCATVRAIHLELGRRAVNAGNPPSALRTHDPFGLRLIHRWPRKMAAGEFLRGRVPLWASVPPSSHIMDPSDRGRQQGKCKIPAELLLPHKRLHHKGESHGPVVLAVQVGVGVQFHVPPALLVPVGGVEQAPVNDPQVVPDERLPAMRR